MAEQSKVDRVLTTVTKVVLLIKAVVGLVIKLRG